MDHLLVDVDLGRLDLAADLRERHLADELVLELADRVVDEDDLAAVRLHGNGHELDHELLGLASPDPDFGLRREEAVYLGLVLGPDREAFFALGAHTLLHQPDLELALLLRAPGEDVGDLNLDFLLLVEFGLDRPGLSLKKHLEGAAVGDPADEVEDHGGGLGVAVLAVGEPQPHLLGLRDARHEFDLQ